MTKCSAPNYPTAKPATAKCPTAKSPMAKIPRTIVGEGCCRKVGGVVAVREMEVVVLLNGVVQIQECLQMLGLQLAHIL